MNITLAVDESNAVNIATSDVGPYYNCAPTLRNLKDLPVTTADTIIVIADDLKEGSAMHCLVIVLQWCWICR